MADDINVSMKTVAVKKCREGLLSHLSHGLHLGHTHGPSHRQNLGRVCSKRGCWASQFAAANLAEAARSCTKTQRSFAHSGNLGTCHVAHCHPHAVATAYPGHDQGVSTHLRHTTPTCRLQALVAKETCTQNRTHEMQKSNILAFKANCIANVA